MQNKTILGAFKRGHRKNVQDYIDEEFSWKLLEAAKNGCKQSQEALVFLAKFNNEYHKNVVKKGDKKALHASHKLRKDCWDRVNAVNRDITSIVGASIKSLDVTIESGGVSLECERTTKQNMNIEAVVVELIDARRGPMLKRIA